MAEKKQVEKILDAGRHRTVRPPLVDAFIQGRQLTGRMKEAVVSYIRKLEGGK